MTFSFKKLIVSVLLVALAALPLAAFDTPSTSSASTSSTTVMSLDANTTDGNSMDGNTTDRNATLLDPLLAQSQALLSLSTDLLNRSESIDANGANTEYVMAMLRLASDIGEMANRIGEMANRIVYTEELIGVMADRIVTVSQALLGNNQSTQTNILEAQRNFGTILIAIH